MQKVSQWWHFFCCRFADDGKINVDIVAKTQLDMVNGLPIAFRVILFVIVNTAVSTLFLYGLYK